MLFGKNKEANEPKADSRVSVMIVDDDESITEGLRELIENELNMPGSVTTSGDGRDALTRYAAYKPRVVILDMMLPKLSGFLVLERMKKDATPPYVIMITANEGRRHMQYAESMGVDSYMLKPINNKKLLDEVKKGLGSGN